MAQAGRATWQEPSLHPPCSPPARTRPSSRGRGASPGSRPAPRAQGTGGGGGSRATGAPGRAAGQPGVRAPCPQGARRPRSGRRGFPDREPAGLSSSVSPPNSCPHRRPCLRVILPKATRSGSRVSTTQTDSVPQGLQHTLPRTEPTAATTGPAVGHWRFFRGRGPHDSVCPKPRYILSTAVTGKVKTMHSLAQDY